jgi:hypothetical protein
MKKITLVLSLILAVSSASFAQYKPTGGEIGLEVNLVPFSNAPIQLNAIKGRFFLSDVMAVRVGFNFDIASVSETFPDPGNINNVEKEKERITDFGLTPGIELHLPVGERVSPYVGVELGFLTRAYKYEYSTNFNNDRVVQTGLNGFTSFGLNLVAGTDLYIYKGLYLGAEFGFGFSSTSFPDVVTTSTTGGVTLTTTIVDNSSVFLFGPNVNSAIRLGWTF